MTAHQDRAFDDLRNTVHEYARILRRRWRLALLAISIVSAVAFWCSQYLPRQYSTAAIFERRDDAVLRNLIHSRSPYSFDQLKSSIAHDMTGSRALAEAAIDLGLLPADAVTSEQALTNAELRRLDTALSAYDLAAAVRLAHSSPSLDTIELRCTANNPTIARRFAIALRDGYIARTRERMTEILSNTRDFFATEVTRYQRQINEANQRLKEQFAEFPGVDPSDPASAGARLEALQTERLRLAQGKAELEAQIQARERFLTSTALTQPPDAQRAPAPAPPAPPALPNTTSAIEQAIKKVEQELADAIVVSRMTNEHPTVKALRRKLENLWAARDAALLPATAANAETPAQHDAAWRLREADPVLAGQRLRVELELDALRAQLEVANQHVEEAEARVERFAALYDRLLRNSDGVQQLQNQLDQDVATAAVWREHLAQLERILAAESEQRGTQFASVEEPKENTYAIKPRAAAIFIVCLGCGLAAAALLVALAELLDRSFRSAGQVTRSLGLPILECIGVINTLRVRRRRLAARLLWTPMLCILVSSLLVTASLAYTSLEYPNLHRRAIAKLDNVLQALGAPPTSLAPSLEE
jgi:uncharacterized protein involved in exopolysaccharide biosynthesis